jgi:hypothetical protein
MESKKPEVDWDDQQDVILYEKVCQKLSSVGMAYTRSYLSFSQKTTSEIVHEAALELIKLVRGGEL